MSRDWTPHEFEMVAKQLGWEVNPALNAIWETKDKNGNWVKTPYFSEDEKVIMNEFPKLSVIGGDFLAHCMRKGIYANEYGKQILHWLEDYFANGTEIPDTKLQETAKLWYDGQLEPGYDLSGNHSAFERFILQMIKEKEDN